jgi:small subunit ribosomal protein S16
MVKIRLRRMGAKKQPTYRFVVADSKAPRDGAFIEILGHYNPRTEPKTLEVNADKAKEWLSKGAQPTETVRRLFAEKGIMDRGPIPTTKRAPRKGKE